MRIHGCSRYFMSERNGSNVEKYMFQAYSNDKKTLDIQNFDSIYWCTAQSGYQITLNRRI